MAFDEKMKIFEAHAVKAIADTSTLKEIRAASCQVVKEKVDGLISLISPLLSKEGAEDIFCYNMLNRCFDKITEYFNNTNNELDELDVAIYHHVICRLLAEASKQIHIEYSHLIK